MEKEYVPYGQEWAKEMNRFKKEQLVEMLKGQFQFSIPAVALLKQVKESYDDKKKYGTPLSILESSILIAVNQLLIINPNK